MFERLKSFFTTGMLAGTALPVEPVPKVKNKQQAFPAYLKTARPSTASPLIRTDRALANLDITSYRASPDSRQTIRDFARSSPDLSAAVTSYVRTGITSGYTAVAKNMDGTFNPEATSALAQVLTRLNVLNNYAVGYDDSLSIRGLSETWAWDLVTQGACAGELVLDKQRLPDKIQPVSPVQIRMFPSTDAKKLVPKQFIAGQYIDLDIPTFFMTWLDADQLEPYPISPIEPAIQGVLYSADFLNDIRRVVKRAIHPRMVVTIDEEKFRKSVPLECQNDEAKTLAYMNGVVESVQTMVNSLNPEDAIIFFDTFGISIVDHGNTNLSNEYTVLQGIADSKLAAGAKVLPTILGHSDGTSNTASAEVLLFLKLVEGTVWAKLNEQFSRTLTLAVRLMGYDVVVDFAYNAIDLKPESELEAFRSMKQSRYLGLLSLGLITDDEAGIVLTGHLPPAGYKPLSGTNFMPNTGAAPVSGDTSSNGGSTMNQNLKPTTPTGVKSQNRGQSAGSSNLTVVS